MTYSRLIMLVAFIVVTLSISHLVDINVWHSTVTADVFPNSGDPKSLIG
ncbi:hypothetical protein JIR001_07260 [Polycladomyces abyssicola]|uniref:Uncharacterized protein n=1 Tax=Polycladomyces abyssicola TaxID=1125966 RepID=A0A8D5ZN38_9BACL|nr:hypothetical protein JIR001_07260 [Polycladomyces abyssicola]